MKLQALHAEQLSCRCEEPVSFVVFSILDHICFDKRHHTLSQSSRASPSTILFALSGVIMLLLGALFFKPRKIATRSGFSEFLPPRAGGDFLQQRLTYQGSSGPGHHGDHMRSYEMRCPSHRQDLFFVTQNTRALDSRGALLGNRVV